MPEFLEDFIHQIDEKREKFHEFITIGRRDERLDDLLALQLIQNWHPLPPVSLDEADAIAVDGSRIRRILANGCILYIVRALALRGRDKEKLLMADVFLTRSTKREIEAYITAKMEQAEFEVAKKMILDRDIKNGYLLIDGSIYGKIAHVVKDSPDEGDRGFFIKYFDTIMDLLKICKERCIIPIGVSKDSRVSHFKEYLLSFILSEELAHLASTLPGHSYEKVNTVLRDVWSNPADALCSLIQLREEVGERLEVFEAIVEEWISGRTDHQLIKAFTNSCGYSTPLELGVKEPRVKTIKKFL
ncbi:MAG: DNA double-strand break repair nuclease NurA [Nitrososphaerota archaeon]